VGEAVLDLTAVWQLTVFGVYGSILALSLGVDGTIRRLIYADTDL